MITEFSEKIPLFFIERYNEEMEAWGANFRKIGPIKAFVLMEGHWSRLSPNEEVGAILVQVKLKAEVVRNGFTDENTKVVVSPASEEDEAKIRHHCEHMQSLGVPSRLFTKEPPRPFLPFMPKVGRPN